MPQEGRNGYKAGLTQVGYIQKIDSAMAIVAAIRTIPTLGPKRAMALYEDLHIASVDELDQALHSEKLRGLKGFGPKTEENLLHGIALLRQTEIYHRMRRFMERYEYFVLPTTQSPRMRPRKKGTNRRYARRPP